MITKKITYKDYNGNERTEEFNFNLSEAELYEIEMSKDGGYTGYAQKIVNAKNMPELVSMFKTMILQSYGEISQDGRQFVKNQQIRDAFAQTEAYSKLFMELATDTNAAIEFFNGLIPADLASKLDKKQIEKQIEEYVSTEDNIATLPQR